MGLFKKKKNKGLEFLDYENLEDFMYDDSSSQDKIPDEDLFSEVERVGDKGFQEEDLFEEDQAQEKEDRAILKVGKEPDKSSLQGYSRDDVGKYIKSQCDIMEEATRNIDLAKEEYSVVTSYFSDIQLIETAPENIATNIKTLADSINELTVDRRIFQSTENKLSNHAYYRMEQLEPSMPNALVNLQNTESYFETVRKDLRILEGERMSLRYDARDLVKKQSVIEKISKLAVVFLAVVFGIFIVASFSMEEQNEVPFMIVIGLAAAIALGLFAVLKATEREVIVTENKLNRAMNLLNKTRIKYINSANTLDYEYAKYKIKSSYDLSRQYEIYLEMKNEKRKMNAITSELDEKDKNLMLILRRLGLYDPNIWLSQIKALINQKEMVEVRHTLSMRRQKLRSQIDYNNSKIEDAKQNVKNVMSARPEYTKEVLDIIEHYESRNNH